MSSIKLFSLSLIVAFASLAFKTAGACGENETDSVCHGHCDHYCGEGPPVCTDACSPGCICADGFQRRDDGKCVRPEECELGDKVEQTTELDFTDSVAYGCGENEVNSNCYGHCQNTCELHGIDFACIEVCIPGCVCADGFVRRKDGKCVKFDECQNLNIAS